MIDMTVRDSRWWAQRLADFIGFTLGLIILCLVMGPYGDGDTAFKNFMEFLSLFLHYFILLSLLWYLGILYLFVTFYVYVRDKNKDTLHGRYSYEIGCFLIHTFIVFLCFAATEEAGILVSMSMFLYVPVTISNFVYFYYIEKDGFRAIFDNKPVMRMWRKVLYTDGIALVTSVTVSGLLSWIIGVDRVEFYLPVLFSLIYFLLFYFPSIIQILILDSQNDCFGWQRIKRELWVFVTVSVLIAIAVAINEITNFLSFPFWVAWTIYIAIKVASIRIIHQREGENKVVLNSHQ